MQVCSLGQRLAEAEAERDGAGARALQLQKLVAESEEGDGGGFGVDSPRLLGFGCCKQVSSPCDVWLLGIWARGGASWPVGALGENGAGVVMLHSNAACFVGFPIHIPKYEQNY